MSACFPTVEGRATITSDAIAVTKYPDALKSLEDLLILLGEPITPADTLKISDDE